MTTTLDQLIRATVDHNQTKDELSGKRKLLMTLIIVSAVVALAGCILDMINSDCIASSIMTIVGFGLLVLLLILAIRLNKKELDNLNIKNKRKGICEFLKGHNIQSLPVIESILSEVESELKEITVDSDRLISSFKTGMASLFLVGAGFLLGNFFDATELKIDSVDLLLSLLWILLLVTLCFIGFMYLRPFHIKSEIRLRIVSRYLTEAKYQYLIDQSDNICEDQEKRHTNKKGILISRHGINIIS